MANKWVYYNDNDPFVCEWVRNLLRAGVVPDGEVDCRSILDVEAKDLAGFRQAHFFCGILGWPYALRLAGWPDDREVWTASCPCQPFSHAGKRQYYADERHLWPAFYRLVGECKPAALFGEQVASRDGREWLIGVRDDLERMGYAVGAADLPAAGVGAPHIRQRLFWVAESADPRSSRTGPQSQHESAFERPRNDGSEIGGVAESGSAGTGRNARSLSREESASRWWSGTAGACGAAGGMADPECDSGEPRRVDVQPGNGAAPPRTGPHAEFGRRGDVGGLADPGGVLRGAVPRFTGEPAAFAEHRESGTGRGAARGLADPDRRKPEPALDAARRARADERQVPLGCSVPRGLADSLRRGSDRAEEAAEAEPGQDGQDDGVSFGSGGVGGLGDPDRARPQGRRLDLGQHPDQHTARSAGEPRGLGDPDRGRREERREPQYGSEQGASRLQPDGSGARGFWDGAQWLVCLDGQARRVEPGIQPLAHGVPGRVGRLRAYGNAIVPQVAAKFVKAFIECRRGANDE